MPFRTKIQGMNDQASSNRAALPAIWGHRGAMDFAPQNTLAAFGMALAQGADGVELDVHLSADGQVVVIHDDTVDATTNATGAVGATDLAGLRSLDAGSWFDPRFAGERIPTLLEVFELMPADKAVNVEIKSRWNLSRADQLALVGLTVDVVRTCRREASVRFSSFDPRIIRHLARLAPELPRGLLMEKQRPWWLRLASGGLSMQAVHPEYGLVDAAFMEGARKCGWRVNVWTVNDPAEARRLAALGVDALITNRPAEIRSALA